MLLLDTHAAIWLTEDQPMSAQAIRAIREAMRAGELLFSAVSAWEIGLLAAKGQIALAVPVRLWLGRLAEKPGVRIISLDADVALNATLLPQPFVQDPADRFLVASARALDVPIVTRDRRILDYAKAGHLRAVKC
jgi:PIN domain nuclease of toxin-antitoxin system